MLNARENFLETIKKGGHPDRLVKQYEGTAFVPGDPVNMFVRGVRHPGMDPKQDLWGTTILWPEGSIGAMPHVTEENKVIKDITCWRDFVKVPDLIANCSAAELWEPYLERAAKVDRSESLLMMFAPTGVFERLHFLMGFEDTFVNLMIEEEAMADLAAAIGEYRYNGIKLMTDAVHPDVMLSHDDWGSKTSLFMNPEVWRELIKPAYVKQYNYLHDNGVIIMHHGDSFCEPIVEDMIDLHIDIWQGVLPQNDIPRLSREIGGLTGQTPRRRRSGPRPAASASSTASWGTSSRASPTAHRERSTPTRTGSSTTRSTATTPSISAFETGLPCGDPTERKAI